MLFLTACLALLLAVFLLAGGDVGAQDPPADDHGDTIIDATELTTTSAVAGNVEIASDVDVFAFELTHDAATTVHVSIYTTGNTDTVGELYSSSDDLIVPVDDSPLADGYNFYILRNLDPGTYYVKVFGTDRVGATMPSTGTYSLNLETETDQGGRIAEVEYDTPLTPGTPVDSVIGPDGDQDMYKIDLSAKTDPTDIVIYTETRVDTVDTIGELLNEVGGQIEYADDTEISPGASDFFIGQTLDPGIYYIAVWGYGVGVGPYKLHVQDLTGSGTTDITLDSTTGSGTAIGFLGDRRDSDTFSFTVQPRQDVFVYTLGPTDTVGNMGALENDDGMMSPGHRGFFLAGNSSGSHALTVTGYEGDTGPYRVVVETAVDPGNSTTDAQELTVSTPRGLTIESPLYGVIDSGTDTDWFKLDLSSLAGTVELILYTTGYTDTKATLLASDGTTEVASDDDTGAGLNFLIKADLAPETYYLEVEGFDSSEIGPYALFAEPVSFLPLDVPAAYSPVRRISLHHAQDIFKLDLSAESSSKDIWIYTEGLVDTYGTLFDSDLNEIASNDDSQLFGRSANFHVRESLQPGVYYVAVSSFNTSLGLYRLRAETVTDPGSSGSITLGETKPGNISDSSDADYFTVDLDGKSNAILFVKGITALFPRLEGLGDVNEYSYPPDEFIIRDDFSANPLVMVTAATPGTYTIQVFEDVAYSGFITNCTTYTNAHDPQVGDDLYACQWHLKNRRESREGEDINVEPVWADGNLGAGTASDPIRVVVVDDGMDLNHPDLSPNVESEYNHDYGTDGIHQPSEHHGTAVAGVIAARDNSFGVRGVAPRAKIFSHNFLANQSLFAESDSMSRSREVTAVSNNSWGPPDGPGLGFANTLWEKAVEKGISEGYGGKGVFYAFAAGNGGDVGDDANLDEVANFYAVTGVCAVNEAGWRSEYSEAGASLWVCAPSGDFTRRHASIVTTENSNRYRYTFDGTSAATPQVAGVAALIRHANPDLTWRDIKLILAATARKNHAGSNGWVEGAEHYGPSTGKYNWNREYGFGVVDAKAAVDEAKMWVNLPPLESDEVEDSTSTTINLSTDIEFIEFVEVRAKFRHPSFRDLEITLRSPDGTATKLLSHFESDEPIPLNGEARFGASQFLGEAPSGNWTITITDMVSNTHSGTLDSWTLRVYGHRPTPVAPAIDTVTAGEESLTVAWSAPAQTRGSGISAYDVLYKDESGVEVIEDSGWRIGNDLEAEITDLVGGVEYSVQVRAVNDSGAGEWSEAVSGTPQRSVGACGDDTGVSSTQTELLADCNALLEMRDTLVGSGTALNWSPTVSIHDWDGVNAPGNRVAWLVLRGKSLVGQILPELGKLTGLVTLDLSGNTLTGSIPTGLGDLTNLTLLNLSGNSLSGSIPIELGSLSNLETLLLRENNLTGDVPSELANLTSLTKLGLGNNMLSGQIPSQLTNLTSLTLLELNDNQLAGQIPSGLSRIPGLETLDLRENNLTGPIPSSLGSITGLGILKLSNNQLTGSIPPQINTLTNLRILDLNGNALSGDVPDLSALTAVRNIALNGNSLTGPVPTWLGDFTYLESLSLSENQLEGGIPSELGNLAKLERLDLHSNLLTGAVPSWLGSLTDLQHVDLSENGLTGEIPTDLDGLTSLTSLNLSNNKLTGPVPGKLDGMTALEALKLGGNSLSGQLPAELNNMIALKELDISENNLTGKIPSLGPLSNLVILRLNGNRLTGSISWLSSLTNLEVLDLSNNGLSGSIPSLSGLRSLTEVQLYNNHLSDSIPSLPSPSILEKLDLHNNRLSGALPSSLGDHDDLVTLSLDRNQLTGQIPTSLGNLTELETLSLWQNPLGGTIPTELGDLSNLQTLLLFENQLTGTIPEELGNLYRLLRLHLDQNELTGMVPPSLGNLTALEELYLALNQLTGCVPGGLLPLPALGENGGNDIDALGLPFCPKPAITSVQPGSGSVVVSWEAPSGYDNYIESYDLRHIPNSSDDSVDANWTVTETRSKSTSHTISSLTAGTEYKVQVRAVFELGAGQWSDSGMGVAGKAAPPPVNPVDRYDTNGIPGIQISELFEAIDNYFDGELSISELFEVIDAYFG